VDKEVLEGEVKRGVVGVSLLIYLFIFIRYHQLA
jgi:hypothetical protein